MNDYSITDKVKRQLAASFVEERDFIDGIREQAAVLPTDRPEVFGFTFMMTLRRPADLETAEIRRIDVQMRPASGGFEIFRVDGLPEP